MAQTIRRIIAGLLVAFALIAFWGAPDGVMNAAVSADVWIVNNASLPGFFLLFAVVGLVLVMPDLWHGAGWVLTRISGRAPLAAVFDPASQECHEETLLSSGEHAVFFRILTMNLTETPKRSVNARLAEVIRESDNLNQITHLLLGVTHTWPPITQFDIPSKGREILDCFYITERGEIWPPYRNWPNSFRSDTFSEAGNYLFKILIDADAEDAIEVKLRLHWTGDWKTASVTLAK